MTNTTTKKGAVKGAVAAAAGIAVLLGGAGTFALWNQSGAIGADNTETGNLTADFSNTTAWKDATPGAETDPIDPATFRMVPGDVLVGTKVIPVVATGENLKVEASLDDSAASLPEGVDASVELSDGATTGSTLELTGSNDGEDYQLTAVVTLTFDPTVGDDVTGDGSLQESMNQSIDLQDVNIKLQQVLNS